MLAEPCADPGIFVRQVQARLPETALTTFFSSFLSSTFTVLQWLINGLFQRNYNFTRFRGGGGGGGGGGGDPIFSRRVKPFPWRGGSNFFQGRVQVLILETHRTCYFPGGVRTLYPPLDPRM